MYCNFSKASSFIQARRNINLVNAVQIVSYYVTVLGL